MRKVITLALAVMLVMAMAVPAFAVSSPSAPVASENKTAALPVAAETLPEGVELVAMTAVPAEAKETVVAAQAALKEAAPEGMAAKYFFYVDAEETVELTLKVAKAAEVVVMQFVDGKWIEVESVLNADGTVTIKGVVEGPIAIFIK